MIKKIFVAGLFGICSLAAQGQYTQINMTVFGMDCPPCAYSIRASMKGIQGVSAVGVDLNTGLVSIKLTAGNTAEMKQFNEAVEKNGFAHRGSDIQVRGMLAGSVARPILEVIGTKDRYLLAPFSSEADLSGLFGKTVVIQGVLPSAARGKVADTLRYKAIGGAS